MPDALVAIPTHDHALLLPLAVRSAQEQTTGDLAIVVIGDGVGDDTRDALAPLLAGDPRVTFLDLPKAGRTGEPHRHPVVHGTDAPLTTYLSDDDLFLPDHVEVLRTTLTDGGVDLACPFPAYLDPDGTVVVDPVDLADPAWVAYQLAGASLLGLTGVAHTTAAYRRLPHGWRTTPPGLYTDQYMWQQFLAQPWCRVATSNRPTTVRFPSPFRTALAPQERHAEMARWAQRTATSDGRAAYVDDVYDALRRAASTARYAAVQSVLAAPEIAEVRQRLALTLAEHDALAAEVDVAVAAHAAALAELARVTADRDHWRDRWSELAATRTVRLRDRLVRSRLLRSLLARRPPAR